MGKRGYLATSGELLEPLRALGTSTRFRLGAIAEQKATAFVGNGFHNIGTCAHRLHQAVTLGNGFGDDCQFVRLCKGAGDGSTVRRFMRFESVCGKTKGTAFQRLRHDISHLLLLFSAGLFLKRAITHDVIADRTVANQAGNVDRRRFFRNRIQILAILFPVPGQTGEDGFARYVFNGLHH